ncbi:ACT domain-containing protein [Candidatus Micrarchaeota archaeon]|nr:ACT domain-containing protein [Candidatus Micrarchaeota archaeon]
MKTLTIVSEDKVGLLADISYVLSKSKINIESVNVEVVAGKAIITLNLSDAEKGKTVLESANYKVEAVNAVIVKLTDQPGELSKITTMLSKEGININNAQTLSRDGNATILSLSVDKPKRATTLLKEYLISSDIY